MANPKYKRGTPEHREFMRTIGKIGGTTNKRRQLAKNPNYYEEIGVKGGNALVKKYGKEMMARWGAVRKGQKYDERWYVDSND